MVRWMAVPRLSCLGIRCILYPATDACTSYLGAGTGLGTSYPY